MSTPNPATAEPLQAEWTKHGKFGIDVGHKKCAQCYDTGSRDLLFDAHNAALAAKQQELEQAQQQSDKNADCIEFATEKWHETRQQLAAEQQELEQTQARNAALSASLAVIAHIPNVSENIREIALAHTMDKNAEAFLIGQLRELREQLAAAVEALNEIDESIPRAAKLPLVVEVKEIAKAALAKIGEGK